MEKQTKPVAWYAHAPPGFAKLSDDVNIIAANKSTTALSSMASHICQVKQEHKACLMSSGTHFTDGRASDYDTL